MILLTVAAVIFGTLSTCYSSPTLRESYPHLQHDLTTVRTIQVQECYKFIFILIGRNDCLGRLYP